MGRTGQPLRFLALVMGGWIMMRLVLLWPQPGALVPATRPINGGHDWANSHLTDPFTPPLGVITPFGLHLLPAGRAKQALAQVTKPARSSHGRGAAPVAVSDPNRVALAVLAFVQFGNPQPVDAQGARAALVVDHTPLRAFVPLAVPVRQGAPRLSGSLWFIARSGNGAGSGLNGGQIGGDQAGLRLAYALGQSRRLAIVGRVATPLAGAGREAAIGLEWQPTGLPVRLVAEQRIALEPGSGGGPAVALVGGLGPQDIGRNFRLEAYAQGGVIKRHEVIGFADGAARISRKIAQAGAIPFDAGAGIWGAAQPGAARLDIGPTAGAVLPIANRSLRLSLDWRQRIAGEARPGSGVALTLGAAF